MSHSYVSGRVQDALKKARGDTTRAQRLLLEWAREDELLLRGLTAPHLKGIVAHAVFHAAGGPSPKSVKAAPLPPEQPPAPPKTMAAPVVKKAPPPKGARTISRADIAAAEGTIGAELLKSLGQTGAEEFGQVGFGGRSSKRKSAGGKASDRHLRAIQQLVEGKPSSHKD